MSVAAQKKVHLIVVASEQGSVRAAPAISQKKVKVRISILEQQLEE